MGTLQSKIEDYIGTYSDTDALSNWLTQGTRILIDLLPKEKLDKISVTTSFTNSVSLAYKKPLYIHLNGYEVREIPIGKKAQAADTNSLYYATATDPVSYIENSNLTILPNGTGTLIFVTYPEVAYNNTNINLMPLELEHLIVLYASIQAQISKLLTKNTILAGITINNIAAISTPSSPSFTYTNPALGTYVNSLIADFGTLPTYTKPTTTFSLTTANTHINTTEDIELANAEMSRQGLLLQQYVDDIQNEVNEYQKEMEIYKSKVQKELQQSQQSQQALLELAKDTTNINLANEAKELEKQIGQFSATLQKYQFDLQSNTTQIQQEGQRVSALIQQYTQGYAQELQLLTVLKAEYNELLQLQLGVGTKNG